MGSGKDPVVKVQYRLADVEQCPVCFAPLKRFEVWDHVRPCLRIFKADQKKAKVPA